MDDGQSTAYSGGAFSRRRVTFAGGVLRSVALGAQGFASDEGIERIVVLGLPGGPGAWRVALQGGGALEAAPGPVTTTAPGAEAHTAAALVVRAPGVRAGDDWAITFTRAA